MSTMSLTCIRTNHSPSFWSSERLLGQSDAVGFALSRSEGQRAYRPFIDLHGSIPGCWRWRPSLRQGVCAVETGGDEHEREGEGDERAEAVSPFRRDANETKAGNCSTRFPYYHHLVFQFSGSPSPGCPIRFRVSCPPRACPHHLSFIRWREVQAAGRAGSSGGGDAYYSGDRCAL